MTINEAATAGLFGCVTAVLVYRARRRLWLSDDDMVYFGSHRVRLARVGGAAEAFDPADWRVDMSAEALATTLGRAEPQLAAGATKADVVIPAIPARELAPTGRKSGASVEAWPEALRLPLLKVGPDAAALKMAAVESGMRSCLVRCDDGQWYRLKGCGNGDQGVVVRTTGEGASAWRELRGVAFLHTAVRELHWTSTLAAPMAAAGVPSANVALGWYSYAAPHAPLGEAGDLRPTCIVEATRGDRRLGTHVLAGLALLLPGLLGPSTERRLEQIRALFPSARPDPASVSTAMLVSDFLLARELFWAGAGPDALGLEWPELRRDAEHCFANTARAAEPSSARPLLGVQPLQRGRPRQWTADGAQPMGAAWRRVWDAAAAELAACPSGVRGRVLPYLYARLGHECGAMLRALHARGVSWGTYQDGMCFNGQWHCNAHSNNFVVLRPEAAGAEAVARDEAEPGALLGFLDLDMAFDGDTFVRLAAFDEKAAAARQDGATAATAAAAAAAAAEPSPAAHAHAELLHREYVNLMEVLAGSDATSGVPQVAIAAVEAQPPLARVAAAALTDTLVAAYQAAYGGEPPLAPVDAELHRCARLLMRLAIVVMGDCRA